MRLLRYGEAAMLAEVADLDAVARLHRRLRAADLPGVRELVPAARTVLITFDPGGTEYGRLSQTVIQVAQPAGDEAERAAGDRSASAPGRDVEPIEIGVHYQGADLGPVAELTGLTEAEVIRRHSAAEYTVAFCGFAPGFAYLRGLDPRLALPRRAEPRTRVPPGAVAIAGEWAAVYPSASPGGWHLLGNTEFPVWDVARTPPSRLQPGAQVRFRCLD